MFQTDPVLFLQSLASGWLTWLVAAVSAAGDAGFVVAVVGAVLLAFDLRRGFVLAQIVIWVHVVAGIAKHLVGLPRPTDVDSAVIDPRSGRGRPTPWSGRDGREFFALLDADVVEWFRSRPDPSYGFPSGHVSATTALWGGLAILYRRRLTVACLLFAVPSMAFARMYLGRHFLADVLGGALLAGIMVLAARELLVRPGAPARWVWCENLPSLAARRRVAMLAALIVAPLAPLLTEAIDRRRIGHLLGLNLAYLALSARGLPVEAPGRWRAFVRAALGAALGLATWTATTPYAGDGALGRLAAGLLTTFVLLWGTVTLGRRIGLYVEARVTPDR